ncbi:MAG: dihydrofolate reductase family protein [Ilumatobacteraceae bacterium]
MRRLVPPPIDGADAEIDVRAALDVARPRPPGRPWVSLCMVSSLDGAISIDGNSRGLSCPADQQVLLTLRRLADVVVVGAGTVRADHYGPPAPDGPRFLVVSRRGAVDLDDPFWKSERVTLVLPEDAPDVPVRTLRAGRGSVDLGAILATLDVDHVLAEGGPRLNGLLVGDDLVDELDLTWSPQLAGGDAPRLTNGAPPGLRPMRLAHLLADGEFLFARYVRVR